MKPDLRETLFGDFLQAGAALAIAQMNAVAAPARKLIADTLATGDCHLELRLNLDSSMAELVVAPNTAGDPVWIARVSPQAN